MDGVPSTAQRSFMRQRVRPARGGDQGFTLVELLVVVVVLGVLAGSVVFGVARFRSDSETAACDADVGLVNSAADAYAAATGTYPRSIADLTAGRYLKAAPAAGSYAFDAGTRTAIRTPACPAAAPTTTSAPTTSPPTKADEDGAQTATDWKVVSGKATISGTTVDVSTAGETRIASLRERSSSDVVVTTTATLRGGQGYGVWIRASLQDPAGVSGYSFQYDATYGNAFVLRQWSAGKECGVPLKVTKMAADLAVYAPHKLVVVAEGDSISATLDGDPVFDLPKLAAAVGASTCKLPLPTGTDAGFRTWGTGTSALFVDTVLS